MKTQRGNTLVGFVIGLILSLSICALVALKWNDLPSSVAATILERTTASPLSAGSMVGADKNGLNLAAPMSSHRQASDFVATEHISGAALVAPGVSSEAAVLGDRTYRLQAGSFKDPHQAEAARAQLALLGIEAIVLHRASDEGSVFRVISGPFDEALMKATRQKLQESGIAAIAVRAANPAVPR